MGSRLAISFAVGFASVVTPCVLPLVPGYLAAVSGVEAGRLGERGTARRVVASSVPFILGFTVVFVALGLLLFFHRDWWLHVALNRALEDLGLTKP